MVLVGYQVTRRILGRNLGPCKENAQSTSAPIMCLVNDLQDAVRVRVGLDVSRREYLVCEFRNGHATAALE